LQQLQPCPTEIGCQPPPSLFGQLPMSCRGLLSYLGRTLGELGTTGESRGQTGAAPNRTHLRLVDDKVETHCTPHDQSDSSIRPIKPLAVCRGVFKSFRCVFACRSLFTWLPSLRPSPPHTTSISVSTHPAWRNHSSLPSGLQTRTWHPSPSGLSLHLIGQTGTGQDDKMMREP
jgi:hypothetical protein